MPNRVTEDQVLEIMPTGTQSSPGMASALRTSNRLTSYVESKDVDSVLDADNLADIELYLAAHFFSLIDKQLSSESTGGASGTYQGQTAQVLEFSPWGQQAMLLDFTGTLGRLNAEAKEGKKHRARVVYLGTKREESPYFEPDP